MSEQPFVKLVQTALKAGCANGEGDCIEIDRALGALKELERFEVTEQLLRKTNGGILVRKLAKNREQSIAVAAKTVISTWKQKIKKENQQAETEFLKTTFAGRSESSNLDQISAKNSETRAPGNSATDTTSFQKTTSLDMSETTLSRINSVASNTKPSKGNRAREVAIAKLAQIFEGEVTNIKTATVNCQKTAEEIEEAIFAQNGEPIAGEYMTKFRSLFSNLKDPKNGQLRQRILKGEISAKQLVQFSSEDLANDEKKKEISDIRKKNLRDCERGVTQNATTDAFTCGKCKAKK